MPSSFINSVFPPCGGCLNIKTGFILFLGIYFRIVLLIILKFLLIVEFVFNVVQAKITSSFAPPIKYFLYFFIFLNVFFLFFCFSDISF